MTAVVVVGPTASGKSELALRLAAERGLEIISVDSMQVYRGMDIGTAKPSPEEQARVPHHMIDVADPAEDYTVAEFQADGRAALESLGGMAVIAGGSGLHLRALIDPLEFPANDPDVRAEVDALEDEAAVAELLALDPAAGDAVDLANPRRVQRALEIARIGGGTPSERAHSDSAVAVRSYQASYPVQMVGLDPSDGLRDRAERRMDEMLESGLLEEVAALAPRLGRNARQAVGYKELLPVVEGEASLDEGRDASVTATVALARRQRTFFRRDPRITWIEWSDESGVRYDAALRALGAQS